MRRLRNRVLRYPLIRTHVFDRADGSRFVWGEDGDRWTLSLLGILNGLPGGPWLAVDMDTERLVRWRAPVRRNLPPCPTGLACTGCRYCETARQKYEEDHNL